LKIDCPALNNTIRAVKSDRSGIALDFNIYCNANWASGWDMGVQNTTSLDDCIQACIALREIQTDNGPCTGIVWDSVMNQKLNPKRNCFLKNGTAFDKWGDKPSFSEYPDTHPAAAIFTKNDGT
jgi:hypothetical protein